ncbi:hypothetical protein MGAST_26940 [Mycobacterium gastri 'Wayne']|nr:hypothetical protein MGAST_26940 [Mycobacterium gastri 'Wayne']
MTSEIGTPAAGVADPAVGLLADDPADVGVLVCECPGWLPMSCEHPATSNGTATSTAIRIDSG